MPDTGAPDPDGAEPGADHAAARAHLEALTSDPHPSVNRAALAAQYPSWGLATMGLLAIGLLIGYLSLSTLGSAFNQCAQSPGLLVCRPRMHAVTVALPVATLIAGLAVSLIGGRVVLRRGASPLLAAGLGWAVFLIGTVVAYVLAGLL
jgi:hypothetical protein